MEVKGNKFTFGFKAARLFKETYGSPLEKYLQDTDMTDYAKFAHIGFLAKGVEISVDEIEDMFDADKSNLTFVMEALNRFLSDYLSILPDAKNEGATA